MKSERSVSLRKPIHEIFRHADGERCERRACSGNGKHNRDKTTDARDPESPALSTSNRCLKTVSAFIAAGLSVLYPLVRTAHLVENAKQRVEDAKADDGGCPEADKDRYQLVVGRFAENKDID